MTSILAQGFHTDLAIFILVGLFDGIRREFDRYYAIKEREDLHRRGYIV